MKPNAFFSSLIIHLIVSFSSHASANSGKVTFLGSIARSPCVMNISENKFYSYDRKITHIPFNIGFTSCDITPDQINVSILELSDPRSISNDISFNLVENKTTILESENGKRESRPMQLEGNYMPNRDGYVAKNFIIKYQ